MFYIANIGLSVNGDQPTAATAALRAGQAFERLVYFFGPKVVLRKVHEATHAKGTELTAVFAVGCDATDTPRTLKMHEQRFARVSEELRQDCIAVMAYPRHGDPFGALYGPKAAEWGPFNPDYFINI